MIFSTSLVVTLSKINLFIYHNSIVIHTCVALLASICCNSIEMNVIINILKTLCGFVPRITLPTRICESGNRITLIENIFTNIIDENNMHTSGNLLNAITDHKAIFTLLDSIKYNDPPPKFIKTEVNDDRSQQTFVDELKELNIYESLDINLQNNPNQNYDTFEQLLLYAKTKHLTTQMIKKIVNISTKKQNG